MAPIVNGLKEEYTGDVVFKVLNVETSDEGSRLADEFGLQFVPTFVFVDSSGEEVNRMVGLISKDALLQQIEALE